MAGKIEGTVVSVTESGDLVTDLSTEQLADTPQDEQTTIRCEDHVTHGLYPEDHGQPDLTFLAILGGGNLILTLVSENASTFLGLTAGCKVTVSW